MRRKTDFQNSRESHVTDVTNVNHAKSLNRRQILKRGVDLSLALGGCALVKHDVGTNAHAYGRTLSSLSAVFFNQAFGAASATYTSAVAKRLIVIYYPNGAILRKWHTQAPQGVTYTKGQPLSFALDPLAAYADKLVTFRGLNSLGHGGSSSHPEAASQILSGGLRNRPSIEVAIAHALGINTPLRYLHLGLFSNYNKGKDYLVFRDNNGNSVLPECSPFLGARLLFPSVLGEAANPVGSGLQDLKLAVLRDVGIQLEKMQVEMAGTQSAVAAQKIAQHRSSLAEVEQIVRRGPAIPGSCGSVDSLALFNDKRKDNEMAEAIVRAHWQNIVAASICDVTRVFGFSFMSAQDDSLYLNFASIRDLLDACDGGGFGSEKKWWNQNQSHSSSHEGNEVFAVQNRWYNKMVAELCDMLNATPDPQGPGTLLDNTLILMCSENGESVNHGQEDVAWYLLGGAGGRVGPGRNVTCYGKGTSDLLLDVARAMGLNWSEYGRSSGGIPNLLI